MTSEEIHNTPAAAVSGSPDTDTMCRWLKEIAWQMAVMNEQLASHAMPSTWRQLPAWPVIDEPPTVNFTTTGEFGKAEADSPAEEPLRASLEDDEPF